MTMSASGPVFVKWSEKFISQEQGHRVVHYYLEDSSGDSYLVVVGIECSLRHMLYVITDEFYQMYEADKLPLSSLKWRSRREEVPEGDPYYLAGQAFVISGTLDSDFPYMQLSGIISLSIGRIRRLQRFYQLEALEKAKKDNTIIFLETGSEKTLIVVMLLRSYAFMIRKPLQHIVVFLIPTVILVTQGLLDALPLVSNDSTTRSALWSILQRVFCLAEENDDGSLDLHRLTLLLLDKYFLIDAMIRGNKDLPIIFLPGEKFENINDQYCTLCAEEETYHFQASSGSLVIKEGETLANVKICIQKKLQVPDDEFSKVVDLLVPYQRGGKIRLSDGVSVGKIGFIMEQIISNVGKG
ncbi:hypothetical protein ZIOFF_073287 [Zingiber officinale]|uniref:Uncharacterized protein n=1 Tax=Zingiber officinale TaxID=94328 RepID=A0A8J5ESM3_ZINOF|nr:hypothetical protein ZIOFF_073287 [Zingiber officinale]